MICSCQLSLSVVECGFTTSVMLRDIQQNPDHDGSKNHAGSTVTDHRHRQAGHRQQSAGDPGIDKSEEDGGQGTGGGQESPQRVLRFSCNEGQAAYQYDHKEDGNQSVSDRAYLLIHDHGGSVVDTSLMTRY